MNWFGTILQFMPLIISAVQHVEATVKSGEDKKAKALDIVTTGLAATRAIDPAILAHPQFQAALGQVNDAIVYAGNIATIVAAQSAPAQ